MQNVALKNLYQIIGYQDSPADFLTRKIQSTKDRFSKKLVFSYKIRILRQQSVVGQGFSPEFAH